MPLTICGYDLTTKNEDVHVLQPGTILQGKYYVGNVLGEGGFGITYIGYDLNLEIKIAIKEFYPNGYVTRESIVSPTITKFKGSSYEQIQKWQDNFIKEARNLAKLTNLPGIVSVRDFFCENDTAYIVMEYVEGTSMTVANKSSGDKKKVYIGICVAVLVIIVIAIKSCTNKSDDVKIESETRQESTVCESMPDEEATVYDATENSEENVVTEDDEYGFASAEIGDVVTFGTYEGEPVEWDVLDKEDGKALLISHHVLRNHTYDQEDEWEGEDTNWEQSEMRAWLNNEFINELFNDQQKSKIQETTLSNPSSASFYSTYYPNASFEENTNPCGDTVDKLFLLSWEEIIKYYGPLSMEDPNGWGYTCAYADSLACTDRDGVVNWYYLRSPGNNGVNALCVDFGGEVNVNIHVNYEGGVRPALCVEY